MSWADDHWISLDKHPELWEVTRKWAVIASMGGGRFMQYEYNRDDYKGAAYIKEAILDCLRNLRFSDTEYNVFADEKLVTDL